MVQPSASLADVALAGVDHRLDGEGHARLQLHARCPAGRSAAPAAPRGSAADAVAAELAHHAEAAALGVALDGVADVAQPCARPHHRDALPHAFVGDLAQALGLHAARRRRTCGWCRRASRP